MKLCTLYEADDIKINNIGRASCSLNWDLGEQGNKVE
jgi:hypothetical protein